jgi:hypothetical protein
MQAEQAATLLLVQTLWIGYSGRSAGAGCLAIFLYQQGNQYTKAQSHASHNFDKELIQNL